MLPSEVIGEENPFIAKLISEESEPDQDVSDTVTEVDDSDLVPVQDADPVIRAPEHDSSAHGVAMLLLMVAALRCGHIVRRLYTDAMLIEMKFQFWS